MQEEYINHIKEYEQRLEENNIKLNELNAQMQTIQGQIAAMSRELEQLKMKQGMPQWQNAQPFFNNMPQQMPPQFAPQNNQVNPAMLNSQKKTDYEHLIGKSWMGIFASVLIFISLILFATLLTPIMTDTIKMILMYVFSFSFTIAGLLCLRKYKNTTVLAIAACGTGLIYLSLFMSHVYFKAYGELALFIFIFVWAVCVAVLGRLQNKIFTYIGYAGILVSVIFGTILCVSHTDSQRFLVLNIYYLVASTVLLGFTIKKEYSENMIHHCFSCVSMIMLSFGQMILGDCACVAGMVLMVTLAIQLLLVLVLLHSKNDDLLGIIVSLFAILFIIVEYVLLVKTDLKEFLPGAIGIVVCVYLIMLIETKLRNQKFSRNYLQVVVLIMLMVTAGTVRIISENGLFLILIAVAYVVLGLIDKCSVYKISGTAAFVIYIFLGEGEFVKLILGLVFLSGLYAGIWLFKDQYSKNVKIISYLMTLLYLLKMSNEIISLISNEFDVKSTVPFVIVAVVHIIAMKTILSLNPNTGIEERGSRQAGYVVNAVLMFTALIMLDDTADEVCHFINVLVAIALFTANSLNLLKNKKNTFTGFYVGIKLTVLLITILGSYDTANAVISIASFLFAIVCIVTGFMIKIKSIRIYGLVLSIISIVKLVLIDIQYDNTFSHAISYLVCGILCFVISMIYTFVDRKLAGS